MVFVFYPNIFKAEAEVGSLKCYLNPVSVEILLVLVPGYVPQDMSSVLEIRVQEAYWGLLMGPLTCGREGTRLGQRELGCHPV